MASTMYTDEQICAKCVDENEVLYDMKEDFVKRLVSVDITCPRELYKELLKNISVCSNVLLMFMKQQIIEEEPRVRYHPANDIYGLKGKIHGTGLSPEIREYLQSISDTGCHILKEAGMLETLVELDSEIPGKVVAFGKTLKMLGCADILFFSPKEIKCQLISDKCKPDSRSTDVSESLATSLTSASNSTAGIGRHSGSKETSDKFKKSRQTAKNERQKTSTSEPTNKIDKHASKTDKEGLKCTNPKSEQKFSKTAPLASNQSYSDRHKVAADCDSSEDEPRNNVHLDKECSTTPLDQSEQSLDCSDWSRGVVTVVVTARNHLSAPAIFKQFLLSYLQPLSKFYFLVLHVGPLVDKQEMSLYGYVPGQKLTDLIQSFDGSVLNHEDDNIQEENEFVVSLTVKKSDSLRATSMKEKPTEKNFLDISEMERCFREVKGYRIQTVAELKQYFRYLVNDCEGVKDHKEDKKNRYARYMAKKELKRQKKQMEKESLRRSADEEEIEKRSLATDCTYTFITD